MKHHAHKYKKYDKFFDRLLFWFAFTTPLLEVPQAYDIYAHHSAHNVSTITWTYFLFANVAFLSYGFSRKLRPIILAYTLYTVVEGIIVVGIFVYR